VRQSQVSLVAIVLLTGFLSYGDTITISNINPRKDAQGNIIDAHDGRLIKFGKQYYIYGTVYGKTTGMTSNYFRSYSSPDLVQWTKNDTLLKGQTPVLEFRPHVVYNRSTKKYVLFFNWYLPGTFNGEVGVATSDRPEGPFAIKTDSLHLSNGSPGDYNILLDYDDNAYIVYTSIAAGHLQFVQKLTGDYLTIASQTTYQVTTTGCTEAAAFFKRDGIYYIALGECCCFCSQGAGAQVYTAKSPMGPYTLVSDINRNAGNSIIIPAQQTFITEIPVSGGMAFLWMGDRWFSAPNGDGAAHSCGDAYSGTKGWDFQYWSPPLSFDTNGTIGNLTNFYNQFKLDLRDSSDEYNVAAWENGGEAGGSSTINSNFYANGVINGDRSGSNWAKGGGWNDSTLNEFPDTLQVAFDTLKTIRKIDIFTLQDNSMAPATVTADMVFTKYGIVNFDVEYWNKTVWKAIPGGTVTNNNKVWTSLAFTPLTTDKIHIIVRSAADSQYSRIVEVEAWGKDASTSTSTIASVALSGKEPALWCTSHSRKGVIGISYELPGNSSTAVIEILGIDGKLVRHFSVDSRVGLHTVAWDGTTDRGQKVNNGVFICVLKLDKTAFKKRMQFLR
jgi:hypothetical protein